MLKQPSYLSTLIILLSTSMIVSAQSPDNVAMKIIVENCLDCHSGTKPKGGLDLSTRENLIKRGRQRTRHRNKQPLKRQNAGST